MSNSGTINAVNAAGTSLPLTAGSYVSINTGPGTTDVSIQISAGMGSMTLHVAQSIDGVSVVQLPDGSILNVGTQAVGAITAAGIYKVTTTGGTLYVYCGAYTSGTANVALSAGFATGEPGATGGGESVIIIPPSAAVSGQIIIAATNTAQQGPNVALSAGVAIKAMTSNGTFGGNSGTVYIGKNSSVTASNGFPLTNLGEGAALAITNLNELYFYGTINDQVAYLGS